MKPYKLESRSWLRIINVTSMLDLVLFLAFTCLIWMYILYIENPGITALELNHGDLVVVALKDSRHMSNDDLIRVLGLFFIRQGKNNRMKKNGLIITCDMMVHQSFYRFRKESHVYLPYDFGL